MTFLGRSGVKLTRVALYVAVGRLVEPGRAWRARPQAGIAVCIRATEI